MKRDEPLFKDLNGQLLSPKAFKTFVDFMIKAMEKIDAL